jgi:hypothetical protein
MTEYIISILENFSAINGKSDSILTTFIKSKRKQIFNYLDKSTSLQNEPEAGQEEKTKPSGTKTKPKK